MARAASRDCLRLLATWPLGLTQAAGMYCEASGLTADGDVATWLTQAAGGCCEAGARREAGDVMSLVTWFPLVGQWADAGGGHGPRGGRLQCFWQRAYVG